MKAFKSKVIILVVLVCMGVSFARCGFILYPERRGQTSGRIDPLVLVLDCLWLFAGVIPGVVALVVDFVTGGIYEGGRAMKAKPGDHLALRLRGEAPAEARLEVTLSSENNFLNYRLLSEDFNKGDVKRDMEIFTIPSDVPDGNYKLAISVNGVQNASWDIEIAQ